MALHTGLYQKDVCRTASILTVNGWAGRICFVNCNCQLGLKGNVREYPRDARADFWSKEPKKEGREQGVSFSFWFEPRYSAMTRRVFRHLKSVINASVCCTVVLVDDLDEVSMGLQKIIRSITVRNDIPATFHIFERVFQMNQSRQ